MQIKYILLNCEHFFVQSLNHIYIIHYNLPESL